MTSAPSLAGRTLLISGGSRGIGLAIALRAAVDGANVCVLAKTATPHPRLEGTIHTAAQEIEAAGGSALAVVGDVRNDADVEEAVARCVERFGGIDICVNNASVINLSGTLEISMKAYDLMHDVNVRGSFQLTRACLPHLLKAPNPHVLMLSPPLNLDPRWLRPHIANTVAKYAMSLWVLGMAEEFRERGVAFNGLWPRTYVATVAVRNKLGGEDSLARSRRPEIMGDAAHAILVRPSGECTGNLFVDDDVLRAEGVTDFARYRYPGAREEDLLPDFFL
jgi:citronellol/citronellal dehydrogenase